MSRALISVHDKTGLAPLGRGLVELGWEIVASGGTAAALQELGLPVMTVEQVTGYPEMLGGRVKTLHPAIHGAILAKGTAEQQAELASHDLQPIELVVCNLYPFQQTVARPNIDLDTALEQIDIGGVTLLRAAAKNHRQVAVLVHPSDYGPLLEEMRSGAVSLATRRRLAHAAIAHTAAYDAAIRDFFEAAGFSGESVEPGALPRSFRLDLVANGTLRYGENPHQAAALYTFAETDGPLGGKLLQGKPLSYNNLLDMDAAWRLVGDFPEPTIAIIKHGNPCGVASAGCLADAFPPALAGDPVAAFGGVLSANRPLDRDTAEQLGDLFLECIAAPAFAGDAVGLLARKQNLRLLQMGAASTLPFDFRSVRGGVLLQQPDVQAENESEWHVVTRRQPDEAEWDDLRYAWRVAKHLKSNAISLVRQRALVGAGAGQMSRIDSVLLAVTKAGDRARDAAMGSDAFFPFPDGVELAAETGVRAVIQPGGSIRDSDVIAAADRLGLAMVFTGRRHFRH